jgi:hypothetical protein
MPLQLKSWLIHSGKVMRASHKRLIIGEEVNIRHPSENAHHCHKLGPTTEITVSVDRCNVSKHLAGKRHNMLMLDSFLQSPPMGAYQVQGNHKEWSSQVQTRVHSGHTNRSKLVDNSCDINVAKPCSIIVRIIPLTMITILHMKPIIKKRV